MSITALPASGRITLAQIQGEFNPSDNSAPHALSEYYRGHGNVEDIIENENIPAVQKTQIKFSDFFGTSDEVGPSSVDLPAINVEDFWQECQGVNNWNDIQDNWKQYVTRINDRHAVAVDVRSEKAKVEVEFNNTGFGPPIMMETGVGEDTGFEKLLRNTQENKDYFEFGEWALTVPNKFYRFRIVATAGGGSGSVQKTELTGDALLNKDLPGLEESGYKGGDAVIISNGATVKMFGAPGGTDPDGIPDVSIIPEQGQYTVKNNGTVTGDYLKISSTTVEHPLVVTKGNYILEAGQKHTIKIVGGGGGGGAGSDDWKDFGAVGTAGTATTIEILKEDGSVHETYSAAGGRRGKGGDRPKWGGGETSTHTRLIGLKYGERGQSSTFGAGGGGGAQGSTGRHGTAGGAGGRGAGGGGGGAGVKWRTGFGGQGGGAGEEKTVEIDLTGKTQNWTMKVTAIGQGGAGGPRDGGSTKGGAGGTGGNGAIEYNSVMSSDKPRFVQFYWSNNVIESYYAGNNSRTTAQEYSGTSYNYISEVNEISRVGETRYYSLTRIPIPESADNDGVADVNWSTSRSNLMEVSGGIETSKPLGKYMHRFPDSAKRYTQDNIVNYTVGEDGNFMLPIGPPTGNARFSVFGDPSKYPINMYYREFDQRAQHQDKKGGSGKGGKSFYGDGTVGAAEYPNISGPEGTPAFGAGGGAGQHGGRGSDAYGYTETYGGYGAPTAYLGDFSCEPGDIINIQVPQGGRESRNEYTEYDEDTGDGQRYVSRADRGGDGLVQIYGLHGPSFTEMSHGGIVLMDDTGRVLKNLYSSGTSKRGVNEGLPSIPNKISVVLNGTTDPSSPKRYYIGYTARIRKSGKFRTPTKFNAPGAKVTITPTFTENVTPTEFQPIYLLPDYQGQEEVSVGTFGTRDAIDNELVPNWFIKKCDVTFTATRDAGDSNTATFTKVESTNADVGPDTITFGPNGGTQTFTVAEDEVYALRPSNITNNRGAAGGTYTIKTYAYEDGRFQLEDRSSVDSWANADLGVTPSMGKFYVETGVTYFSCGRETNSSGRTAGTVRNYVAAVVMSHDDPGAWKNDNNNDDRITYTYTDTQVIVDFGSGMVHTHDRVSTDPDGVQSENGGLDLFSGSSWLGGW